MQPEAVLLPAAGLVGIVAAVWTWMYITRVREMHRRRIRPQDLADHDRARELLARVAAPADNLANLFEMPVLFYVALVIFYVTATADPLVLSLAWGYVVMRGLHSLIHISYNRVMHRFVVYVVSSLVLFTLWVILAARLLRPLTA